MCPTQFMSNALRRISLFITEFLDFAGAVPFKIAARVPGSDTAVLPPELVSVAVAFGRR